MAGKKQGETTRSGRKAKKQGKKPDGEQKARRAWLLQYQWDWSPPRIYKEMIARWGVSRETVRTDVVWLTELCVSEFEAGEEREVSRLYDKFEQTAELFTDLSVGKPVLNPMTGKVVTCLNDKEEVVVVLERDHKAADIALKARTAQSRLMGTRGTARWSKHLRKAELRLAEAKADVVEQEVAIGKREAAASKKSDELREQGMSGGVGGGRRSPQRLDRETRSALVRTAMLGSLGISEVLTRFTRAKEDPNAKAKSDAAVAVAVDVSVNVVVDVAGLRGDRPF